MSEEREIVGTVEVNPGCGMWLMFFLLVMLVSGLVSALKGQTAPAATSAASTPEDGRVVEPALSQLNAAYDSTLEAGWCVTDWHLAPDGYVVVTGVTPSTATRFADRYSIIFDCPTPDTPTLHTHPPAWPHPSPTDQREGLIDKRAPFIVVQSGVNRFGFWIIRRTR